MTLKRFMTMEGITNGGLSEWAKTLIKQAYTEGKKEGKAQENRRLRSQYQKWRRFLDNPDRK